MVFWHLTFLAVVLLAVTAAMDWIAIVVMAELFTPPDTITGATDNVPPGAMTETIDGWELLLPHTSVCKLDKAFSAPNGSGGGRSVFLIVWNAMRCRSCWTVLETVFCISLKYLQNISTHTGSCSPFSTGPLLWTPGKRSLAAVSSATLILPWKLFREIGRNLLTSRIKKNKYWLDNKNMK